MYAKTQYVATSEALEQYQKRMGRRDPPKPQTAPPGPLTPEGAELGMLQFKPNGFLYQKRMQGEWNNGALGSRNYSAVRLAEGEALEGQPLQDDLQGAAPGALERRRPARLLQGPRPHLREHGPCAQTQVGLPGLLRAVRRRGAAGLRRALAGGRDAYSYPGERAACVCVCCV